MVACPAAIEIKVLTPHGQPVAGAVVRLIGAGVDGLAQESAPGVYDALLPAPGDYALFIERVNRLGGFDHRTLRTTLFYLDDRDGPGLLSLRPPDTDRSRVDEIRREGDRYHLRVILDYLWFSAIGYPPTLGNQVDVLTDGELGWGAVAEAARGAKISVRLTSWLYEPSTTLERPQPVSDPEEREPYTVQSMLESLADAGVRVQLLLWDAPFARLPEVLREKAQTADDNFEVMQERNPTRRSLFGEGEKHLYNGILGKFAVGSYHQKTVVVDGRIGFCGGMNLKENDWDTRHHHLFEPRRCHFHRTASFREQVRARILQADYPPRHDFIARVEGPAVVQLEENFRERWNRLIAAGADYGDFATLVEAPRPIAPDRGSSQVQVVRTMPEPFSERGILDVYLRAIGTARRLIYIEDQYFRSTQLSDALADAVRTWPDLKLVVVTVEGGDLEMFTRSWAYECFARIERRKPFFELYSLRIGAEDAYGKRSLVEVDNHAKLMIVDDLFLTVGSCNINDRGFEYEGEINLAVVDPDLVHRFRVELWREHLGGDARVSGDIDADVSVWEEHAERNRVLDPATDGLPESHVFPFTPRRCRKSIMGADIF
jgi:phosphatidylserine/phosphatidylglycerophosphate/cardiolipin synthase-like enzyme